MSLIKIKYGCKSDIDLFLIKIKYKYNSNIELFFINIKYKYKSNIELYIIKIKYKYKYKSIIELSLIILKLKINDNDLFPKVMEISFNSFLHSKNLIILSYIFLLFIISSII